MKKILSMLLALALCLSLLSVGALADGEAAEETEAAGETAELAEDEAAAETAVEETQVAEAPAAEESEPVTEPETAEETEDASEESPAPEPTETEPAETETPETDEAAPVGEDANEETEIVSVEASDAAATSGTCGDNLTWTLDSDGVLTISGAGAMDRETPWGTSITKVVIEEGVTEIGGSAFRSCTSLTSVEIPSSVTSITFEGNVPSIKHIDAKMALLFCGVTATVYYYENCGWTSENMLDYDGTLTWVSLGAKGNVVALGDVTGDGVINVNDDICLFQYANKQISSL